VKTAAFALLARVFLAAQGGADVHDLSFERVLMVLAVLTMVVGNLLAVPQQSVKRMLAYSSIAHAGYLVVGVAATRVAEAREQALSGLLCYLASYTVSAIGAFAVLGALERRGRTASDEPDDACDVDRLAGLARRRPLMAFAMAVFMLSLAGVPPTAGFVAKLLVFKAALGADLVGLAVVGVLTSVLGAWYYLRVVVAMYMRPAAAGEPEPAASPVLSLALGVSLAAVVVLGVGPEPVARLARAAAALVR
jgi:NADH-quinone oxidoreductase subunit N